MVIVSSCVQKSSVLRTTPRRMKDFFVANATSETVLVKAFDDDVEVRKLMKTGGSTRGELKLGVDQAGVKAYFNVALEIFSKKTVVEMGKPPKLGYAPLAPLHVRHCRNSIMKVIIQEYQ